MPIPNQEAFIDDIIVEIGAKNTDCIDFLHRKNILTVAQPNIKNSGFSFTITTFFKTTVKKKPTALKKIIDSSSQDEFIAHHDAYQIMVASKLRENNHPYTLTAASPITTALVKKLFDSELQKEIAEFLSSYRLDREAIDTDSTYANRIDGAVQAATDALILKLEKLFTNTPVEFFDSGKILKSVPELVKKIAEKKYPDYALISIDQQLAVALGELNRAEYNEREKLDALKRELLLNWKNECLAKQHAQNLMITIEEQPRNTINADKDTSFIKINSEAQKSLMSARTREIRRKAAEQLAEEKREKEEACKKARLLLSQTLAASSKLSPSLLATVQALVDNQFTSLEEINAARQTLEKADEKRIQTELRFMARTRLNLLMSSYVDLPPDVIAAAQAMYNNQDATSKQLTAARKTIEEAEAKRLVIELRKAEEARVKREVAANKIRHAILPRLARNKLKKLRAEKILFLIEEAREKENIIRAKFASDVKITEEDIKIIKNQATKELRYAFMRPTEAIINAKREAMRADRASKKCDIADPNSKNALILKLDALEKKLLALQAEYLERIKSNHEYHGGLNKLFCFFTVQGKHKSASEKNRETVVMILQLSNTLGFLRGEPHVVYDKQWGFEPAAKTNDPKSRLGRLRIELNGLQKNDFLANVPMIHQ